MAIRPEEVMKRVTEEDAALLKRLEARVDAEIRDHFDGTRAVDVDLLNGVRGKLRPAVKERLKQIYRDAGWTTTIEEGSCQRDGEWCRLKLTPGRRQPSGGDFRDQVSGGPYT